jgi:hypothetical protein
MTPSDVAAPVREAFEVFEIAPMDLRAGGG